MRSNTSPDSLIRRYLSLWSPVVAWCGVIFYLSHIPHLRITETAWDLLLRKMAHMVEYGILTLLLWRALAGSFQWPMRQLAIISVLLAVLYACSDEYHQSFVVGRHGSPVDVLIDTTGMLAAAIFRRRFRR